MPGRSVHKFAGTVAGVAASAASEEQVTLPNILIGGAVGHVAAQLPDLLEPATSPHHRQFLHSWTMTIAIGYGLKKAYDWQPETNEERFYRSMLLIVGAAYFSHLVLDSFTKKSLPLI